MYDINTLQCYTGKTTTASSSSSEDKMNGVSGINSLSFAPRTGSFFVGAGLDGSITIWDTVSFSRQSKISLAHGGSQVYSVRVNGSERYILSAGQVW